MAGECLDLIKFGVHTKMKRFFLSFHYFHRILLHLLQYLFNRIFVNVWVCVCVYAFFPIHTEFFGFA